MRALAIAGFTARSNNNNNPHSSENNHDPGPDTPTRSRNPNARPLLRPLSQSSDHNAMMRQNAPLTAKSGNANSMPPYDKQNGVRPLMPTLSATAKTSSRTPLTPRVAGSAPPAATTPLSRRGARSDNPVSENSTPPASSREDLSTPISTFLTNNNITPRSGSRKSRVDSTNTTPLGTPTGTPVPTPTAESFRIAQDSSSHGDSTAGLGFNGMDRDIPQRATVSFSPAVSEVGHTKVPGSTSGDSKFFFASDAKSVPIARSPLPSKSSSTFFYANGESIPSPPQPSGGSTVGSTVWEERAQPKFFHANGTPDLRSSPNPHFPPPRPSSAVSTSSRMTFPRFPSPGTLSPPQRPTSPSKLNQQASIPSLRPAPNLPSPVLPRPQQQGRGQSASSVVPSRRISIEGLPRVGHGRSASFDSPEPKASSRRVSSGSSFEASAFPAPSLITTSVPVSTPEEASEDAQAATDTSSEVLSPVKTGHSLEQMNKLAANARRERKVLDLEITNSSLAAINRTLEREMRKQTAELRRYRRLSRSGRLSIATAASVRSSSSGLSTMEGMEGTELSDMSEEESEEESDYDSSEESIDDGTLSPGAMAESDFRHRKKDEQRLILDLSKHQQLLIDSQKMNQSLKRCMGWTEEMINEGKKALAYTVRVSDVELAPRVLAPDEVEDAENEGMSDIGAALLKQARIAAANGTVVWGGEGRDDRDSGIDLDGLSREPLLYAPLP